jgi:hypothetical protein
MFRALLAHPQEALYKHHLVYCMRVVSWLHQVWSGTATLVRRRQPYPTYKPEVGILMNVNVRICVPVTVIL